MCVYWNTQLLSSVEIQSPDRDLAKWHRNGLFFKAWKGAGISALLFPCVHRECAVFLADILLGKGYCLSEASTFSAPSSILSFLFASGNTIFLPANTSKVFIDPPICSFWGLVLLIFLMLLTVFYVCPQPVSLKLKHINILFFLQSSWTKLSLAGCSLLLLYLLSFFLSWILYTEFFIRIMLPWYKRLAC